MINVDLVDFTVHHDPDYGTLVAVEGAQDLPFEIKRAYYIYGVPNRQRRGFHAHKALNQALICLSGHVMVHVRTPYEHQELLLDSPSKALLVGPMVWREMYNFSEGAVLLVLADRHYEEADYIRDCDEYAFCASTYFAMKEV